MNKYLTNIKAFYEQPSYNQLIGVPQNGETIFKELYYMPRHVTSLPGAMASSMVNSFTQAGKKHSALYLHIPFCKLRCSYCSFYRNPFNEEHVKQYVKALLTELELLQNNGIFSETTIDAVFFGGGTPSVFNSKQITAILNKIHSSAKLATDCELTFESSIYDLTQEKLQACLDSGINRFSFGVQTFDTNLRRTLGRLNTEVEVTKLLKTASNTNAKIIIDLIYGLPNQTTSMLLTDIDKAIDCGISGMDLYKLQIMPKSPLGQAIEKGSLLYDYAPKDLLEMYLAADEHLQKKAATQLSCCHWAFSSNEKSLYNTLVKSGTNIIACGINCGGRMGAYKYMKLMNKEAYEAALNQKKYPVMAIGKQNGAYELLEQLAGQCDKGILNLNTLQNCEHTNWSMLLNPIIKHWLNIGLLKHQDDTYLFTANGKYYYRQMERVLLTALEYALYGKPDITEQESPKMMGVMKNMK